MAIECSICGKELTPKEHPSGICLVCQYIKSLDVDLLNALDWKNKFISNINDDVKKKVRTIKYVFGLLILLCIIPLLFYSSHLIFERVIYASIGVLTFISIFYSLLVSDIGVKKIDGRIERIELIKKKIEEVSNEEINKRDIPELKDVVTIGKIKIEAESCIEKLEEFKEFTDIRESLVGAVFCLLISIVLSLVDIPQLQFFAYLFFLCGFIFSGIIVISWKIISTNLGTLDINLKKDEEGISIQ